MKVDEHYASVIIHALVNAAWQETLTRVAHVGARTVLQLARSRAGKP